MDDNVFKGGSDADGVSGSKLRPPARVVSAMSAIQSQNTETSPLVEPPYDVGNERHSSGANYVRLLINFVQATIASFFNFAGCTFLLFAIPFGIWFGVVTIGAAVIGANEVAAGTSKGVGLAALFWLIASALILAAYFLVRKQNNWIKAIAFILPVPFAFAVYLNVGTLQFFSALMNGDIAKLQDSVQPQ